jgi:hypothetical protein
VAPIDDRSLIDTHVARFRSVHVVASRKNDPARDYGRQGYLGRDSKR